MRETVLEPVGVRVDGISLSDVDAAVLRGLLAEHGFVLMPNARADDGDFVAFLRQFGPLRFTAGEIPVDGFPDLNVISNVGRTTPPRSTFHTDSSYWRQPPAYTALRTVQNPEQGGETLFTNQYRAFDTLPPEVRMALEGRTITHVVTGLDLADDQERSAEHPVFREHPLSGRTALFL